MNVTTLLVRRPPSDGAKALAEALGIRRVSPEYCKLSVLKKATAINWGCSSIEAYSRYEDIINHPFAVSIAVNKLSTLKKLHEEGVPTPNFAVSKKQALAEWANNDTVVFARTSLTGSGGDGIVVGPLKDAPEAPLYTNLFEKRSYEFRVHVFPEQGKTLLGEKRKAKDSPANTGTDKYVRSNRNGWVFCYNDLASPKAIQVWANQTAMDAVSALGLDFGAVDIVWSDASKSGVVLEVNSAPGLAHSKSLEFYCSGLTALLEGSNE